MGNGGTRVVTLVYQHWLFDRHSVKSSVLLNIPMYLCVKPLFPGVQGRVKNPPDNYYILINKYVGQISLLTGLDYSQPTV